MPKKSISGDRGSAISLKSKGILKVYAFKGVALAGGKTDKTCIANVDYYPEQDKIFLSLLEEGIKSTVKGTSDALVLDSLTKGKKKPQLIGMNAPLRLPKCMRCRLRCPGYENCRESEILWLWKHYKARNSKKRPRKFFTPYTERCSEFYIANELEEKFHPPHALGTNLAPLTARAHYLQRRIKAPIIEVYPKLSLWRIGRSLGIQKSYLRFHKHSIEGDDSRMSILERLIERDIAFVYEQDRRSMVENNQAFEAFLCALTAVLKFRGQVEKRPPGFPKSESWIEIPKKNIYWGT